MSSELDRYKRKSEQPQEDSSDPKFVKLDTEAIGNDIHTQKVHVEGYNRNERVTYVVDAKKVPIERTKKIHKKDGQIVLREVTERVYEPSTGTIVTRHGIEETTASPPQSVTGSLTFVGNELRNWMKCFPSEREVIEEENKIEKNLFEDEKKDYYRKNISCLWSSKLKNINDIDNRINYLEKKFERALKFEGQGSYHPYGISSNELNELYSLKKALRTMKKLKITHVDSPLLR